MRSWVTRAMVPMYVGRRVQYRLESSYRDLSSAIVPGEKPLLSELEGQLTIKDNQEMYPIRL
jgi:hypothetical protein